MAGTNSGNFVRSGGLPAPGLALLFVEVFFLGDGTVITGTDTLTSSRFLSTEKILRLSVEHAVARTFVIHEQHLELL